jgi:hypothetical protein
MASARRMLGGKVASVAAAMPVPVALWRNLRRVVMVGLVGLEYLMVAPQGA